MGTNVIPYINYFSPFGWLRVSDHKLTRLIEEEQFRLKHQLEFDTLTTRELEIISCLAMGLNNLQISEQLFISRSTVEQHRKNINRKLSISSFSHLFQYALAFDLV
ncbi:MAG: helix-turn-helix transcriptional regulator [Bacteroidota bacterium]